MGRWFGSLCVFAMLLCGASLENDAQIANFESLIKAGKYLEARSALESYVQAHSDSWRAQYQLGYVYFRLHLIQPSVTALCKSLVLNRDFAESHKILAYDLNILGRQDMALDELRRAIQLNPDSADSHYEMGRIYYERGSYLDSVRELESAKSLAPEFVRVYHNLGLAYSAIGDDAIAVRNFEEGLRRNDRQTAPSAWPLIDYATFLNMRGEFDQARQLLLRAIAIEDKWDEEFEELAKAYRGRGETTAAIQALESAIARNPKKAELHYMLARLYWQTHQTASARQELAEYERDRGR